MHATTKSTSDESSATLLAIDLAKNVFELAFADAVGLLEAARCGDTRMQPLPPCRG